MRDLNRPLCIAVCLCLIGPWVVTEASAAPKRAAPVKAREKAAPKKAAPSDSGKATRRAPEPASNAAATANAPPTRGPTRIDFDDRLIQGQTNRSGAVYLYDRKELANPSMVQKRESFREEIVSGVYGS